MTQRFLVIAAAVAAAASLAAAGRAAADCNASHTVASKDTSPAASVQPPTTLAAPKPAEPSTREAKADTSRDGTETRTADVRPAAR